jgi:hypothetical protein
MRFFPELARLCPDVKFYGVGGDDLAAHGMELFYHLKDFSSMGFSEVVQKIPFYFNALKRLEAEAVDLERTDPEPVAAGDQTVGGPGEHLPPPQAERTKQRVVERAVEDRPLEDAVQLGQAGRGA